MNKKIMATAFAALMGFGFQAAAIAEECPDRTKTNEQTNAKFLAEGIAIAEQALEHAKQGHGPETKDATKESLLKFKCIVTNRGESQMQGPKARIKMGGIKAGKGDTAAAIPLLEEGIAGMKNVDMTPRGL
ncbi:MAG: hypothetical protein ACU843_13510 [Gammaproteobacteria bacterium]